MDSYQVELMNTARTQLINEYLQNRTNDLTKWLEESGQTWKTERVILPYPPSPAYPFEQEIQERFEMLSKALEVIEQKPAESTEEVPPPCEEDVQEKPAPIQFKSKRRR